MKVICIRGINASAKWKGSVDGRYYKGSNSDVIIEGEMYTVDLQETFFDQLYYRLSEKPLDARYRADRFIPLSDIDERELINEREEYLA